jgi:signal transduction histidine kinase
LLFFSREKARIVMGLSFDDGTRSRQGLRITLISIDTHLLELCHETLRELGEECCDISLVRTPQGPFQPSDLLIWDTDLSDGLKANRPTLSPNQQQLFLVSRKRSHPFLAEMPLGAGSTLLKPVSKRTLQIFLEQALNRSLSQHSRSFVDSPPMSTQDNDTLQCLLMANLKLQEYDQDRTNFFARAVHDFRAPLMAANGYCSILSQQTLGPLTDRQMDVLKRMDRSLRKLTRMASAMFQLNIGKTIIRGINLQESSLEACFKFALQEIEHITNDKNITIELNFSDGQAPIYFDQEQIEQVIVNLLDNACRFTPKGGRVEVRGYPVWSCDVVSDHGREISPGSPKAYRVDIRDTGPGILTEHLETVFEEYTSYGGPEDRSGGGLGLAICKMIVAAHGGHIWAENYRGGGELCFALPAGNLHARKRIMPNQELRVVTRRAVS